MSPISPIKKEETPKFTCGTCSWCVAKGQEGVCHLNPPVVLVLADENDNQDIYSARPEVTCADAACSNYLAKE